ncbi:hypothetical protein D3C80_2115030 [compost metagenome]
MHGLHLVLQFGLQDCLAFAQGINGFKLFGIDLQGQVLEVDGFLQLAFQVGLP